MLAYYGDTSGSVACLYGLLGLPVCLPACCLAGWRPPAAGDGGSGAAAAVAAAALAAAAADVAAAARKREQRNGRKARRESRSGVGWGKRRRQRR